MRGTVLYRASSYLWDKLDKLLYPVVLNSLCEPVGRDPLVVQVGRSSFSVSISTSMPMQ